MPARFAAPTRNPCRRPRRLNAYQPADKSRHFEVVFNSRAPAREHRDAGIRVAAAATQRRAFTTAGSAAVADRAIAFAQQEASDAPAPDYRSARPDVAELTIELATEHCSASACAGHSFATASLVSRWRGDGCFTPAMHKPSRSRPAGSARYCFSTRRPTPRARIDRRGSATRVIGSRRAIAGFASCPPFLCHEPRSGSWRILPLEAVAAARTTAPGGRSSATSRLQPWQRHGEAGGAARAEAVVARPGRARLDVGDRDNIPS